MADRVFLAGGYISWQARCLACSRARGTRMADAYQNRQRIAGELRLLLPELLDACTAYRAAKARYRRRRDAFAGSVNQEIEVAQDRLAKRAIADCNWYGSEMERMATTLLALQAVLDRGRQRPGGAPP